MEIQVPRFNANLHSGQNQVSGLRRYGVCVPFTH